MANPLTKFQKTERRCKRILEMEAKDKRNRRNTQVKQYIEMKMIKGHSREQASKMAKEIYDGQ
jgi:hypothetical protein